MTSEREKQEKLCRMIRRAMIVADEAGSALAHYYLSMALDEAEAQMKQIRVPREKQN